jgi:hypothetical protein
MHKLEELKLEKLMKISFPLVLRPSHTWHKREERERERDRGGTH